MTEENSRMNKCVFLKVGYFFLFPFIDILEYFMKDQLELCFSDISVTTFKVI